MQAYVAFSRVQFDGIWFAQANRQLDRQRSWSLKRYPAPSSGLRIHRNILTIHRKLLDRPHSVKWWRWRMKVLVALVALEKASRKPIESSEYDNDLESP